MIHVLIILVVVTFGQAISFAQIQSICMPYHSCYQSIISFYFIYIYIYIYMHMLLILLIVIIVITALICSQ